MRIFREARLPLGKTVIGGNMKRLLLLFLCLMLMAGSIAPAQADTESHAVTPMEYPFYLDSADVQLSTPFPLYFSQPGISDFNSTL